MSVTTTQLYQHLSEKLNKDIAEVLTSFIEEKIKDTADTKFPDIATKDFVKAQISEAKSDIVKWLFLFWVAQIASTFGFILLFLKK